MDVGLDNEYAVDDRYVPLYCSTTAATTVRSAIRRLREMAEV